MYRRRRPSREIAFSFDSFLDLVTNVVGIIIRLILVVWVGARSYTALPESNKPAPHEDVSPELENPGPDPLEDLVAKDRQALEAIQLDLVEELAQLRALESEKQSLVGRIKDLLPRRKSLSEEGKKFAGDRLSREQSLAQASLTLDEIRKRSAKLSEEIAALKKQPPIKNALYYQTPVSRPVEAEEILFECQKGRVTFIDIAPLLEQVRSHFQEKAESLRTKWEVEDVTEPSGSYRLHYVVERERGAFDEVLPNGPPSGQTNFSYGVTQWTVEPINPKRGETLSEALRPQSEFRHIVNTLDARQSVVTFWVYPDSFEVYRQLRDFLYDRDIVVAGRPLPDGVPISSSRHGTVSRGQ